MDYISLRDTAIRLIWENGKTATLRVVSGGTFDPVTGGTSGAVTTDYITKAIEIQFLQSERNGTMVQQGDRKFVMSVLSSTGAAIPTPTSKDTLTIGTSVLSIVSVEPKQPGDDKIVYFVHCRGLT